MAHQHQVVDSDIRFAINPITRAITRVEAKKSSLVVGDHNSERFTFEIPKIVEGHDMALCNVIRIHYLNTSSDNKSNQSLGVYEVDDFAPDPEDENVLKFSWLISKKATKYVGPLAFTVQFACMTGFKVDYSWQSGVFSGITVSNAINAAEVVIEEYADILRQWWEQLYASSDLPITVMPVEDFEALNGNTRNGMLYILTDDPAVEDLKKIPGMESSITTLNTLHASLEEKVEDEVIPAIQENAENIKNIQGNQTDINTRLVNIEEDIVPVAQESAEKIEAVQSIQTAINTRVAILEEDVVPGIEKSMGALNTDVLRLGTEVSNTSTGLSAVREVVASIGLERQWGEYTKLYEYDIATDTRATTSVITGLYMVKAEYFTSSGDYRVSTTAMLDTAAKGNGSALTSFRIPTENGAVDNYIIRGGTVDPSGNVVDIVPYYINLSNQCDYSYAVKHIRLYGRRIYTNPVNVDMSYKRPFIVTPLTKISEDGVLYYLRVMGVYRVESDEGSVDSKFERYLYLNSAAPAAFTVTGTNVKSNKGVIETSLGDIVIIDDISIHGKNPKVSVVDDNFTLYCENVATYTNTGSIYQDFALVDMNNNSSIPVTPLTEISGDNVMHYLRVTGRCTIGDRDGAMEKDFEGVLYLKSDSLVTFTAKGVSIKSNKGVLETSLGDIVIVDDIRPHDESDPGIYISVIDNAFTLYCAVVHEALG